MADSNEEEFKTECDLLAEAARVNLTKELPEGYKDKPIKEGEVVAGVVSDITRRTHRLFVLAAIEIDPLVNQVERLESEIHACRTCPKCKCKEKRAATNGLWQKIQPMMLRSYTISRMLAEMVRREFPEAETRMCTIHEDGQLVFGQPKSEDVDLVELLERDCGVTVVELPELQGMLGKKDKVVVH